MVIDPISSTKPYFSDNSSQFGTVQFPVGPFVHDDHVFALPPSHPSRSFSKVNVLCPFVPVFSLTFPKLSSSYHRCRWKDLAVETSKVYQLSSVKAMEKEENYPVPPMATSFADLEYNNLDHLHHNHQQPQHHHQQHQISSGFYGGSTSMDKVSFAEVMQFADFGPKLGLTQNKMVEEYQSGMDPIYFLKFPVLNDKVDDQSLMASREEETDERFREMGMADRARVFGEEEEFFRRENSDPSSVQLRILEEDMQINNNPLAEGKNKRKRPRTIKTSEEVESQRMTHIAVERNRRKQMNEHLRVLRALMPGSYVQRGDQASIIGGAIEFVRELEQLLQCLESQKRRRIMGEAPRQIGESSTVGIQQNQPPFFPPLPLPNEQPKIMDFETGLREETAENKSGLADVEVKLLGFDAMIKILSRRRPGQLIKTIAALEDLQLNILHTNITTIEQTVLYSFNVKVAGESRFSAEDIATSVQQIFSFINANNA